MEFLADLWSELRTVGLTALFNSTFLFLLVVLFFAGRLVGWLIKSVNLWRIIAFAYFMLFLYRPLMDAGLVIGGVFVLGAVSAQMDRFRRIFGGEFSLGGGFFRWFSGLWDGWLMRRNDQLHDENERLKEELREERRKNQQRSNGPSQGGGGGTAQDKWRQQARERAQAAQGDGDGKDGQSSTRSGPRRQEERKPRQESRRRGSGSRRSQGGENRKRGSGQRRERRSADENKKTERPKSNSSRNNGQSTQKRQTTTGANSSSHQQSARPKQEQRSQQQSQRQSAGTQGQQQKTNTGSKSQSQSSQQNTGSQNQGGQSQQQGSGYRMSQLAKNKLLKDLGLAPDKNYTKEELKKARNKAAFKAHPDQGGSTDAMVKVTKAYNLLMSEAD